MLVHTITGVRFGFTMDRFLFVTYYPFIEVVVDHMGHHLILGYQLVAQITFNQFRNQYYNEIGSTTINKKRINVGNRSLGR